MDIVEYTYRFDPNNPSQKAHPDSAKSARLALENGNRMFSRWLDTCRSGGTKSEAHFVVQRNGLEVGLTDDLDQPPQQTPFAVVVGCSDARVPIELLFDQGFNDLFIVRVAGNVLGDVCRGSIDYALAALIESVKVIVVLGHTGCGAVGAAVDSYLDPTKLLATTSYPLRGIQERIYAAVGQAARGLKEVWGNEAASAPLYRGALIESAVALNAAQSAYDLYKEVERGGKKGVDVLFGVFNLCNHQVSMPSVPDAPIADENVGLAPAPTDPSDFKALAIQMAKVLKQKYYKPPSTLKTEVKSRKTNRTHT